MKPTMLKSFSLAALVCVLMASASRAQQVPSPKTPADVPGPPPGTALSKAYVQTGGWHTHDGEASDTAVSFDGHIIHGPEVGWHARSAATGVAETSSLVA